MSNPVIGGLSQESLTTALRAITDGLKTLANGAAIERHNVAAGEIRALLKGQEGLGSWTVPELSPDFVESLRRRYTPTPVPPCRVCGGNLDVSQCGGGKSTVYACGAATRADNSTDWDHYEKSQFTHLTAGDSDVIAFIDAATADPHNWFPDKWVMDAMRSLLKINADSQRSTITKLRSRIEELERGRGKPGDEWLNMASAPRDGTMVRLLVEFEEHSTEDADQAPTIGANNFDNDGEDRWQFAGWCWLHDHFVEGKGVPVGWLPMLHVQQAPAALPEGYCIMPRSLTAENGAKALLLGEFKVTVTNECPECAELDDQNEHCAICDGEGQYRQSHTISWDQIKFIYSKAVGGLSLSPGRAELQAARIAELDRLRGEALTFTYKHPSTTERRSVSLSRAEVAEGMESTLYEKLVAQLCQCESVGETNVVDCNCHQYGHDFERVAETDTEGSAV